MHLKRLFKWECMNFQYAKIIVFFVCFWSITFYAHDFDAILNLGGDCQVAYQLKHHGLRTYALPFDGLITPYEALYQLLANNFEGFLDPDNFALIEPYDESKYIFDKKYGTKLIHDFRCDESFLNDYEVFAAKYSRRIERFLNLLLTSDYPLFIRKRITREQTIALRDLLLTIRQGNPFLLVVLHGTEEMKVDWQLEFVRNYYLKQLEPYSWEGDPQAWLEIFQNLGLEVSQETIT